MLRPLIQEIVTKHTPESLVEALLSLEGVVLLRTSVFDSPSARYSLLAAHPFLTFRSEGSGCEIVVNRVPDTAAAMPRHQRQFGNPWHVLESLMSRFELLDEIDRPFPLGGAFGFWGYDLKNFTEPRLARRAINDLELTDCQVGFYDSLVVFDHSLNTAFIVSTGLNADGSRTEKTAIEKVEYWRSLLARCPPETRSELPRPHFDRADVASNVSPEAFISAVARAQEYIRAGDIYQVNLSHRLTVKLPVRGICSAETPRLDSINLSQLSSVAEGLGRVTPVRAVAASAGAIDLNKPSSITDHRIPSPLRGERVRVRGEITGKPQTFSEVPGQLSSSTAAWDLFLRLTAVSPAPFSAFLDCGDFQLVSSSPEQFLRMSGSQIVTRPIKGTRPRDAEPTRDAVLAYELQTSAKENAELVMITDLLRNDLGKICEYGTVQTPELARIERFAQVQHLISTVEGRLRREVTHFAAFASCFPGGSITGAPKFRAMEIIDELEPVSRGPYTGAIGYLGFNRESQLSIAIRTALCHEGLAHFNVGAGIVADSNPQSEYEETLAKARGFMAAMDLGPGKQFD
jgi:anthranilate/para-aminobenzoate synthase component I